jgi:hypothetical protein
MSDSSQCVHGAECEKCRTIRARVAQNKFACPNLLTPKKASAHFRLLLRIVEQTEEWNKYTRDDDKKIIAQKDMLDALECIKSMFCNIDHVLSTQRGVWMTEADCRDFLRICKNYGCTMRCRPDEFPFPHVLAEHDQCALPSAHACAASA